MNFIRLFLFAYWLALTVGLVHPQGGNVTGLGVDQFGDHPDLPHFVAFAVLAMLAQAARLPASGRYVMATLLVYAAVAELAQALIPGRTANLLDGLANILGILAGLTFWWLITSVPRFVKGP